MKFNKVRLPLAASVSSTDPLTFGTPEAGYNDMTSYDGFGWVPYMVTWGTDKYEIGVGSFASGSFTRRVIHENDLSSAAAQAITTPATFMVLQTMQNSLANSGSGTAPPAVSAAYSMAAGNGAVASGFGSLALGYGTASSGENSAALGVNNTAAGWNAIAIMGDATADKSVSIGGGGASAVGEVRIANYSRRDFSAVTSDDTPTLAVPTSGAATQLVVPEGEIWYIKARVMATEFDTGTFYPLAAQVRSFSCLAAFDGMLGSLTAATDATFGTFTGTSTLSVTAGGAVHFTLTGVAATEIQWSIAVEFQRLTDWNF